MAILYNRMSKAYDNFKVSQQRSGTLTLTWELKNGGENGASYFASQTLLIDSDKSGLKTLVLESAARTVTLSSENISDIKYGNDAKYSFRLVGTPTDSNADKVKSASLKDKHFFVLPRPDVTIVGTPDGMKLTFNDNLPTLLREGETGLGANDLMTGNEVTGAEISLSYVNNGELELDSYVAPIGKITGGVDGIGRVVFIGDESKNTSNAVGVALINGRDYEVSVRYITKELGLSPATFDETVR